MDSIGGMLNPDGEMPKNTLKKGILLWFYWKKIMVYDVILMETIGMSVMFTVLSCYVRFDIKGIKIMASDAINYKYHIKSMSLW